MTTLPPRISQGVVPQSTIVPDDDNLFIPYFTRTYENLAQAINAKDNTQFTAAITSTPTNIPNIANYGSFLLCVSGEGSGLPAITIGLCKASNAAAGASSAITSQAGTDAPWVGKVLTVTSTASNFQIAHNAAGVTGNFNFRIIGTQ